jgi:two-component system LytT family response regulator
MTTELRIAVVEDEEPQRKQLVSWLSRMDGITLVGEVGDGASAIQLIDAEEPDVVFLDISLPEYSGVDVLRRISCDPQIIFATAHRDYAIEAFELGAVDYLLKPFGLPRVEEALARIRERAPSQSTTSVADRIASVSDEAGPLTRLFVRDRSELVPVSVDEIVRLETDGDYTAVLTATRRYLVALPLKVLHDRIRRRDFLRIHRQHVVNVAFVDRIVPYDASRLAVHLKPGGRVIASRAGSQLLRGLAT